MSNKNSEGGYRAARNRAIGQMAAEEYYTLNPAKAAEMRLWGTIGKLEKEPAWKSYVGAAKQFGIVALMVKNGQIVVWRKDAAGLVKHIELGSSLAEVLRNLDGLNGG